MVRIAASRSLSHKDPAYRSLCSVGKIKRVDRVSLADAETDVPNGFAAEAFF
jgi:hypothetical protein